MESEAVRQALDSMGIGWDDPIRSEAMEFAQRPTDEKLLWLFVEQRRHKVVPGLVERFMAGASGGGVVLVGLVAHALGWTDKVLPR